MNGAAVSGGDRIGARLCLYLYLCVVLGRFVIACGDGGRRRHRHPRRPCRATLMNGGGAGDGGLCLCLCLGLCLGRGGRLSYDFLSPQRELSRSLQASLRAGLKLARPV